MSTTDEEKTNIKEIEIVTGDVVGMHVRVETVDEFETQLAEQCKISVNLHACLVAYVVKASQGATSLQPTSHRGRR